MTQIVKTASVVTCVRNGYTSTPTGYAVGGPGTSPSYNNSVYMTFPSLGIPAGATIDSATLSFNMTDWDWAAAMTMYVKCAVGAGTPTNQVATQGTADTTSVGASTLVDSFNATNTVVAMVANSDPYLKVYTVNGDNRKNFSTSPTPTLTINYTDTGTVDMGPGVLNRTTEGCVWRDVFDSDSTADYTSYKAGGGASFTISSSVATMGATLQTTMHETGTGVVAGCRWKRSGTYGAGPMLCKDGTPAADADVDGYALYMTGTQASLRKFTDNGLTTLGTDSSTGIPGDGVWANGRILDSGSTVYAYWSTSGDSITNYISGSDSTYAGPYYGGFRTPAGTGQVDDAYLTTGWTITVNGLPDGAYVRATNGAVTWDSSAATGGAATVNVSQAVWPLDRLGVWNGSPSGGTAVEMGYVTNATYDFMSGGDVYDWVPQDTFGFDAPTFATSQSLGADNKFVGYFSVAEGGEAISISCVVDGNDSTDTHIKGGFYESGQAQRLMGNATAPAATVAAADTHAVKTLTFSTPVYFPAGEYGLAFQADGNTWFFEEESDGSHENYSDTYSDGLSNPIGSSTASGSRLFAFYITYTPVDYATLNPGLLAPATAEMYAPTVSATKVKTVDFVGDAIATASALSPTPTVRVTISKTVGFTGYNIARASTSSPLPTITGTKAKTVSFSGYAIATASANVVQLPTITATKSKTIFWTGYAIATASANVVQLPSVRTTVSKTVLWTGYAIATASANVVQLPSVTATKSKTVFWTGYAIATASASLVQLPSITTTVTKTVGFTGYGIATASALAPIPSITTTGSKTVVWTGYGIATASASSPAPAITGTKAKTVVFTGYAIGTASASLPTPTVTATKSKTFVGAVGTASATAIIPTIDATIGIISVTVTAPTALTASADIRLPSVTATKVIISRPEPCTASASMRTPSITTTSARWVVPPTACTASAAGVLPAISGSAKFVSSVVATASAASVIPTVRTTYIKLVSVPAPSTASADMPEPFIIATSPEGVTIHFFGAAIMAASASARTPLMHGEATLAVMPTMNATIAATYPDITTLESLVLSVSVQTWGFLAEWVVA